MWQLTVEWTTTAMQHRRFLAAISAPTAMRHRNIQFRFAHFRSLLARSDHTRKPIMNAINEEITRSAKGSSAGIQTFATCWHATKPATPRQIVAK